MQVTYLPVKPDGLVDLDLLRDAIRPETALVSIMMVNNEIGEPGTSASRPCKKCAFPSAAPPIILATPPVPFSCMI